MTPGVPDELLHLDLDTGDIRRERLPDTWVRAFIGGKGIGARYLYDRLDPGTDPLGRENVLALMVGPLTGYLPGGGRFAAITKSPLTGLFLDSYAGGSFGPALRAAYPNVAGVIVSGASETTRVLDLRDGSPTLRSAPNLAGRDTDEVDARFPDASVLCIGPAGEHEVAFATIAVDGGAHHAGRGGAGAVMGAKGLKAVVLEDDRPSTDDAELVSLRRETRDAFADTAYARSYRAAGTHESITFADALAMLPTRGWRERTFDGADALGADTVAAEADAREHGDETFPGDYRIRVDEYDSVMRGGTPMALGAGLGVADVDVVSALGATCDRLGIDVISAGNAVALGILASRTGAIDRALAFGEGTQLQELLEEIGTAASSLGRLLGRGVEVAGSTLDLDHAIPTVKSMALPSYDPRGAPAMALGYATSDRGACHRRAVPATVDALNGDLTPTQIAETVIDEQDRRALHWCLIVDDVVDPMVGELGRRWLRACGLSLGREALGRVGTRTWTLTRLFNLREGVDREADSLPEQFRTGADRIPRKTFERTLDRYYERREWDRQGRPSARLLDRLDLRSTCDADTPIGAPPLRSDVSP